jgi:hypothetical protein
MLVELKKVYKEVDDFWTIKLEIDDTNDDPMVTSIIDRKFRYLNNALNSTYEDHKELYNLIAENKYDSHEYDPYSSRFSDVSPGWRKFCKDITKRELQIFTDIYTDLILERIEYINQQYRKQSAGTVETGVIEDNEVAKLSELQFTDKMMVFSNNQAFELQLREVENIKTIDDYKEEIYKTVRTDSDRQFKRNKDQYHKKNIQLKAKLEKENNEKFVDMCINYDEMLGEWEFHTDNEGVLWLKLKHAIECDKVHFNGRLYDYNEEQFANPDDYKRMYLSGLKIKVKTYISNSDVSCTRGYNLHFSGTSTCIGELSGKPLMRVVKELPRELKIANMGSVLNHTVKSYLTNKFIPNVTHETALNTNAWVRN